MSMAQQLPLKAKKENTTLKSHVPDKYIMLLLEIVLSDLELHFDIYHRTSEPIHYDTSQEFLES